jgi:hypothetical protein
VKRYFLASVCVGALFTLSMGCSGFYKTSGEKLKIEVRRFNENVRWQRFRAAAKSIPTERRDDWVGAMEHAATALRITDYDVRPVEVGTDIALMDVDIGYHRIDQVVIKRVRRRQTWRYEGGGWMLESETDIPIVDGPVPENLPRLQAAPESGEPSG